MNCRQLARFTIPERDIHERPDAVAALFAKLKIVPVRAESLFAEQCIEYTAISEQFAGCPFGEIPPLVNIQSVINSLGNIESVEVNITD